jgi:hypothetical protein
MRSTTTIDRTATAIALRPFSFPAKAIDPAGHFKMAAIFVLALLTMIGAGMMTMYPGNASQAQGLTSMATQGLASTKSDRAVQVPATKVCESQAWGAWSEDCAAALTGATSVRNVSFVTVERSAPTVNETILARYPVAN